MAGPELSFEDFCQRLLSLFDEGRFTATYKYAVLIGLLDVLAERVDRQGRAPAVVHTRDLAGAGRHVPLPRGDVPRKRQIDLGFRHGNDNRISLPDDHRCLCLTPRSLRPRLRGRLR